MGVSRVARTGSLRSVIFGLLVLFGGCVGGCSTSTSQADGSQAIVGEEHEVNYGAPEAFILTQEALQGQGVLFKIESDNSLVTLWRDADVPAGFFADLAGVKARYRYEIDVVPEATHKSKIVVNVRTEGIPDSDLDQYKVTKRLNLFQHIDQLVLNFPPSEGTPRSGGVNFALLPNEDLKALAKRVTGNEDNWNQIAKDNGVSSPSDVSGLQSVWVRDSLVYPAKSKGVGASRE